MPKRDADFFKISVSQVRQHRQVDVILGKPLCVLPETELLQPVGDLLHRGSAPDYRASFTRVDKTTRQILNAVDAPARWQIAEHLQQLCSTAAQFAGAAHASEPAVGTAEGSSHSERTSDHRRGNTTRDA